MLGLCICNLDFVLSHGDDGVAFSYSPAVASKRSIYISAGFFHQCSDLANIVKFAISTFQSNWKEITTLEEFADLASKASMRKFLATIFDKFLLMLAVSVLLLFQWSLSLKWFSGRVFPAAQGSTCPSLACLHAKKLKPSMKRMYLTKQVSPNIL